MAKTGGSRIQTWVIFIPELPVCPLVCCLWLHTVLLSRGNTDFGEMMVQKTLLGSLDRCNEFKGDSTFLVE